MSASETMTAPTETRGRALNITLWVLQVLLAAFFAFAGINKLFIHQQEMVDNFAKFGLGVGFQYFVGAIELVGAIGLLIPRLSGLAAIWLAGIMVGAALTHVFVLPPVYLAVGPVVLAIVFGLIAWGRWPQTKALIAALKR
jgi:uncharacterized membrane protein